MDRRQFLYGAGALTLGAAFSPTLHAQTTRIRRDVTNLRFDDPFFAKYSDAVRRMHRLPASDPRNWRNQALIHLRFCPHSAQDFFHWHRHYIAYFEAICGELISDPTFALPYWNWSQSAGRIPNPFYDNAQLDVVRLGDRSDAQSDNWGSVTTVGRRALRKGRGLQDDPRFGRAFSARAISDILALPNFTSFTNSLEGSPHNNGHVIVGGANGHMGSGMSPLDPIFWLHHCNVDRLWAQWQRAGNRSPSLSMAYNSQFVDGKGVAVANATSEQALSFANFGYSYDIFAPAAVSEARRMELESAGPQRTEAAVDTTEKTLGVEVAKREARTGAVTAATVSATNLRPELFSAREFFTTESVGAGSPRVGMEGRRILATISDVTAPPGGAPIIVNVFVNSPELSATTPSSDPHYAGSFSFFGGHEHNGRLSFTVDITDPLRHLAERGVLNPETIKVQLLPVPLEEGAQVPAVFTFGKVEVKAS